jgi:hypothetical protein
MPTGEPQPALMPIPAPWRPRRRRNPSLPHWSRWRGAPTSCDDCVAARAGLARPDTDLLRALWRVEKDGRVALVCSVHAARRGR